MQEGGEGRVIMLEGGGRGGQGGRSGGELDVIHAPGKIIDRLCKPYDFLTFLFFAWSESGTNKTLKITCSE